MKYLGVDYGTKKVGLAFSDDDGSLAFPHSVVPNDNALFDTIRELIQTNGVDVLVIGHSLAMDGRENPVMEQAHAFKEVFERSGLHVYLEPEFLTTFQAKRNTEDAMADAAAAALILQSFLDKQENKNISS
mgnify:FL=1|tara:strand:+ start:504 stop:896 length:393 start_codon:yes stop_codon:yes gene_type:complete